MEGTIQASEESRVRSAIPFFEGAVDFGRFEFLGFLGATFFTPVICYRNAAESIGDVPENGLADRSEILQRQPLHSEMDPERNR